MLTQHVTRVLAWGALTLTAGLALACSSGASTNSAAPAAPASAAATVAAAVSASPAASTPAVAAAAPAGAAAAVACQTGAINAVGSTALQPLVEAAARLYQSSCPGAKITVQGGGSGSGLTQVAQGAANIGDSDIFAEDMKGLDAKSLADHQIARQGFVQAVNPSVTGVKNLTKKQSIDIWTGKVKNWKDLGGPDQPIALVIRPASSGTRATFKKLVLDGADEATGKALTEDSNGAIADAITTTPGAIGVIGLTYVLTTGPGLAPLQYEGVDPSVANVANESYKIFSFGHMYTRGEASGLVKSFLDYMLAADVQNGPVKDLNYAPIKP